MDLGTVFGLGLLAAMLVGAYALRRRAMNQPRIGTIKFMDWADELVKVVIELPGGKKFFAAVTKGEARCMNVDERIQFWVDWAREAVTENTQGKVYGFCGTSRKVEKVLHYRWLRGFVDPDLEFGG